MILSMSNQFTVFLLTIVIGFFTGMLYDFFRIVRKIFKHPDFLIQIEDILYWVLVTIAMFQFIINKNDGELRWFLIIGLMVGMVVYFYTISTFTIKVLMSLIDIIEKILRTVLSILFFPIKIILRILAVPFNFIKKRFKKVGNKAGGRLKKIGGYGKMKLKGFKNNLKIIFKKI